MSSDPSLYVWPHGYAFLCMEDLPLPQELGDAYLDRVDVYEQFED